MAAVRHVLAVAEVPFVPERASFCIIVLITAIYTATGSSSVYDAMCSLYEPLDENDIRLLTVSVHDGATASLELHTYPQTAAPEYDAVSYTWGDGASAALVICNGVSLEIRIDLFRALPFIYDFGPEPKTRPYGLTLSIKPK